MKINAIKNITTKQYQVNSNPIRKTHDIQQKDILELSFRAKKAKYSDEFLKLTKNDKYLQKHLEELCMLDENKKFNPEYEKYFLDMVRSLNPEDKNTPSTLRHFALAINTARRFSLDEEAIPFFFGNMMALSKYNYLDNEIESIFNSSNFDIGMPAAYITLQDLVQDDMTFDEKTFFITKFCKTPDGLTNSERIVGLVEIFNLLQPQYMDVSEKIYSVLLDKDGNFNMTKCAFVLDCLDSIFRYTYKNDSNFVELMQTDGEQASGIIISTLKKLIEQNEEKNGEFDIEKAKETFNTWYDYVKENGEYLNQTLCVDVFDVQEDKTSKMNIKAIGKKYPNKMIYFDNTVYKLCSLFTYPHGKIN